MAYILYIYVPYMWHIWKRFNFTYDTYIVIYGIEPSDHRTGTERTVRDAAGQRDTLGTAGVCRSVERQLRYNFSCFGSPTFVVMSLLWLPDVSSYFSCTLLQSLGSPVVQRHLLQSAQLSCSVLQSPAVFRLTPYFMPNTALKSDQPCNALAVCMILRICSRNE